MPRPEHMSSALLQMNTVQLMHAFEHPTQAYDGHGYLTGTENLRPERVLEDTFVFSKMNFQQPTLAMQFCKVPDACCSRQRLHNEISRAAVPGPPLLCLLVKGSDVCSGTNGGKECEGCHPSAFHAHLFEQVACPAGLHSSRQHPVGSLIHPTAQSCKPY